MDITILIASALVLYIIRNYVREIIWKTICYGVLIYLIIQGAAKLVSTLPLFAIN